MSPICSLLRSSRTLTSFSKGMMTSRTPLRLAARTFSLMPPMGSTWPVRVISPVMARLVRTLRSVSMLRRAVAMVMPALGPSLGMAPAGTWMWMSLVLKRSGSMPYLVALPRTQVSAACTDSRSEAGAGAVLGDGAGGHVDVDVAGLEEVGIDAVLGGVAADPGERGLHRFQIGGRRWGRPWGWRRRARGCGCRWS